MRSITVSLDAGAGRFVAEGSLRGQTINVNAPKSDAESRRPTGFSATELLLAGAGACAAWDVLEMLRKRRHELSALEVVVEGEQSDEAPWEYLRIALHFRVQCSGLRSSVLERVVRLSCVRYCSVLATVRGVADLAATMELIEPDGTSAGRLPVSLVLEPGQAGEEAGETADALGQPPATDED
jgi:putative redox protein